MVKLDFSNNWKYNDFELVSLYYNDSVKMVSFSLLNFSMRIWFRL